MTTEMEKEPDLVEIDEPKVRGKQPDSKVTLNCVLQCLPLPEVISLIFNRLELEDRLSSRSVCPLWNNYVNKTLHFYPLLYDNSEEEVLNFGRTGAELDTLTISKLLAFEYPKCGLGFSKIRHLKLIPFVNTRVEPNVVHGISEVNLRKFLRQYDNIEELSLHSNALNAISCPSLLQIVELKYLEHLEISAFNADGRGFMVAVDILKNIFPSLKSIDIILINHEDSMSNIPLRYEDVYRFMANHASTLENIVLHHNNCRNEKELQWFDFLSDHAMPHDDYVDLSEKLEKVQVSSLEMRLTHYEGISRFQFGIILLKAQVNLTTLKIENLAHPNIKAWKAIPSVIEKCSNTLVTVVIEGCFCPAEADRMEIFSCSCTKNCNRLKTLCMEFCGMQVSNIADLPRQIKVLNLGQSLERHQINHICTHMKEVTMLNLPQGRANFSNDVPKVNIEIFKEVVKLPNLTQLILMKRSCAYKRIRRIVSYAAGIEEGPPESLDEKYEYGSYFMLTFDRSQFDSSRI